MTLNELREKRTATWKAMNAFLESRTNTDGVLCEEDDAMYTKMEKDFDTLTN